jgi:hypothetical protein
MEKPTQTIIFQAFVQALRAARDSGYPHATLYWQDGQWQFGVAGTFLSPPEGTFLSPLIDREVDDEELDVIAARWTESELASYPLPPGVEVIDEEVPEEVMADYLSDLLGALLELPMELPCIGHQRPTRQARVLGIIGKDEIPLYVFVPMCPECLEEHEAQIASLDAVAAARRFLGEAHG